MKLNTYLNFDGDCRAAFQFYEKCLGGRNLLLMTWGESPMAEEATPEIRDRIIARLSGDR